MVCQVAAEAVVGRGAGFKGLPDQLHVRLFQHMTPIAPVARWAGRHQIRPTMFAAPVAGDDVVYRQLVRFPAAILAGIIITPQDFTALKSEPVRSLYGQRAMVVPVLVRLLIRELAGQKVIMSTQEVATGSILAARFPAAR